MPWWRDPISLWPRDRFRPQIDRGPGTPEVYTGFGKCQRRTSARLRLGVFFRGVLRLLLLLDLDALDLDWLPRSVVGAGWGGGDLVDRQHPVDHLAEGGVLVVQIWVVSVHDEELRAGRVGVVGAGHGEDAARVPGVVELGLELVARAARARAGGVAALDHEPGDDAVEDD